MKKRIALARIALFSALLLSTSLCRGVALDLPDLANVLPREKGVIIAARLSDRAPFFVSNSRLASLLFPSGSIFKIVSFVAALESGIDPERRRVCGGEISLEGEAFRCSLQGGHGSVNLEEAFVHSCNIYFASLGRELGAGRVARYAALMGFSLFPSQGKEALLHEKAPGGRDSLSLGRFTVGEAGTKISPLQASVLLQKLLSHSFPFSPATYERLERGMSRIVLEGTAQSVLTPSISLAGKTGTPYPYGDPGRSAGWFLGYSPSHNPSILVVVFLRDGSGVAAAEVAMKMLKVLRGQGLLKEEAGEREPEVAGSLPGEVPGAATGAAAAAGLAPGAGALPAAELPLAGLVPLADGGGSMEGSGRSTAGSRLSPVVPGRPFPLVGGPGQNGIPSHVRVGLSSGGWKEVFLASPALISSGGRSFVTRSPYLCKGAGRKVIFLKDGYLAEREIEAPFVIQGLRDLVFIGPAMEEVQPCSGKLFVSLHGEGIQVVNDLPLERYVEGVVAHEMPGYWEEEALMAQAVVARSFALSELGRHRREGFDFCPLTHCQAYRGLDPQPVNPGSSGGGSMVDRVRSAARKTSGLVLTYRGKIARVYYHSTCGGKTSPPADEKSGSPPYLRGVVDPYCKISPFFGWRVFLSWNDLERIMKGEGILEGEVKEITIAGHDPSGRVKGVIVMGESEVALPGEEFWQMAGEALGWGKLPSSLFTVRRKSGGGVTLEGRGLGHGVGLCQWGAEGLARKGRGFRTILSYYFPGTRVARVH